MNSQHPKHRVHQQVMTGLSCISHTQTHTHVCTDNLESPVHLSHLFDMKVEHPVKTLMNKGKTCKLYTKVTPAKNWSGKLHAVSRHCYSSSQCAVRLQKKRGHKGWSSEWGTRKLLIMVLWFPLSTKFPLELRTDKLRSLFKLTFPSWCHICRSLFVRMAYRVGNSHFVCSYLEKNTKWDMQMRLSLNRT